MAYSSWSDFRRRILAAGCAVLIFALGILTASVSLHQQLHAGDQTGGDDGCAVALFASGVSLVVPVTAPPPVVVEWTELRVGESREILLEAPRYLWQPERGPPVG